MIKIEGKVGGKLEDTMLVNGIILDNVGPAQTLPVSATSLARM